MPQDRRPKQHFMDPISEARRRISHARVKGSTELILTGLDLSALPPEVADLPALTELDVSQNNFSVVDPVIFGLPLLQKLNIANNRIKSIVQIGNLASLTELDASGNQLVSVPRSITRCANLTVLSLSSNPLRRVPVPILHLRKLRSLSLSATGISELPREIGQFEFLESLVCAENAITEIPDDLCDILRLRYLAVGRNPIVSLPTSIGRLRNLRGLDAGMSATVYEWRDEMMSWSLRRAPGNGRLQHFPDSMLQMEALQELFIDGQPLGLPPEVVGPSWADCRKPPREYQPARAASILRFYFNNRASRPLNEAKLVLVGRGGAGKTSIVNRLVHGRYDCAEKKTDGIAITQWMIRVAGEDVKLNVWDFGGQEIMHATHQFFMTKRSLYVLVVNAREGEQDANIEYWLRLIAGFGGESPVLIVINKVCDHRLELNRRGLQKKFSSICGFVETDCESLVGIGDLKVAIARETDRLAHLRDPFPSSWFSVKDTMANLKRSEGVNHISFSRYQQICSERGIHDSQSQDDLVSFLHDLGVVVNFRDDPRLAETHVLNPHWVTSGIYKIINADGLARKHGELSALSLPEILGSSEYPRSMHLYLVDLMRKFELCYEYYDNSGSYLVPELLGKEEPDLSRFQSDDSLTFKYQYQNILPDGLLPRFMVRTRVLNKDLPRWRTGAVLHWEGNHAIVRADIQDRCVSIAVTGPSAGRRRLLAVVRADFEHIHDSMARLEVSEVVPVAGYDGLTVNYNALCVFERSGESSYPIVHEEQLVRVDVQKVLDGIDGDLRVSPFSPSQTKKLRQVRIAFSYSHKDEELRDQLEIHLKLLQRQAVIRTWHDRRILAGEEWRCAIDEAFAQADVILLLVSSDFIASEFCYEAEMRTALDRHRRGDAIVIPILVRACDWASAPFADLQGLPLPMRPIASWENRDEAWLTVVNGIKDAVERLQQRGRSTHVES